MATALSIAGLKFLVVDDSQTLRRFVRDMLGQMGCKDVDEAEGSAAAQQLLKRCRYEVVICDLQMPRLDGFDFLKAVQAEPRLGRIPVLIVTAEARREDIEMASQCGAAGYIVKPFGVTALKDKVHQILRRRAAAA